MAHSDREIAGDGLEEFWEESWSCGTVFTPTARLVTVIADDGWVGFRATIPCRRSGGTVGQRNLRRNGRSGYRPVDRGSEALGNVNVAHRESKLKGEVV